MHLYHREHSIRPRFISRHKFLNCQPCWSCRFWLHLPVLYNGYFNARQLRTGQAYQSGPGRNSSDILDKTFRDSFGKGGQHLTKNLLAKSKPSNHIVGWNLFLLMLLWYGAAIIAEGWLFWLPWYHRRGSVEGKAPSRFPRVRDFTKASNKWISKFFGHIKQPGRYSVSRARHEASEFATEAEDQITVDVNSVTPTPLLGLNDPGFSEQRPRPTITEN
jgi:hypothetical protein